ncbi:MAG: formylglycine-generating enzyme family protein [Kiritimatiellae bacterium]|nr:formylglycine-generating enzyme family protein [Kiritimatiellia bacterium]
MKTNRTIILLLAMFGIAGSGCNSSNEKGYERSVSLQDGVLLELVKTPRGFWIGKTEVTQEQWETVMGDNPSAFKGGDHPVDSVSWNDCQKFLEKLNEMPAVANSDLVFRLPNEDEWEFACRAGSSNDYSRLRNGTDVSKADLDGVAWFETNAKEQTHSVGKKAPNAFGLHDMHGNVWEWTSTEEGGDRVLRGGSWNQSSDSCKSSNRGRYSPSFTYRTLGFRLCADGKAD